MSAVDNRTPEPRATVTPEPMPPGPGPVVPSPDVPNPDVPAPGSPRPDPPMPPPEVPLPDPEPRPDLGREPGLEVVDALTDHAADVRVVLRGDVAILEGVVESALERSQIVDAVGSLDSISRVESFLRPPAA